MAEPPSDKNEEATARATRVHRGLPRIGTGRRQFITSATGALALAPGASAQIIPLAPTASGEASVVTVRQFGAAGDGVVDDTAAIQKAIDHVSGAGGAVIFPAGRYLVTRTLRVKSPYPVSLLGEMFGQFYDAKGASSALLVGAAMDYVIEYAAPDGLGRGAHGSGLVQRIAFVDPTSRDNGSPGRRTVKAALYLRDFSLGMVDACVFHWIRGSAVQTEYAVMTTIRGCRIRYCGDPDAKQRSAIQVGGSSSEYTSQSFLIDDTRVEVCYSAAYIGVTSDSYDVAIRSCNFEAATVEYPGSSNSFVDLAGDRFLVDGCTFNRTDGVAAILGGRGKLVSCHFVNGIGKATSLSVTGSHCIVSNCIFEDNRTALSIDCGGSQNTISGNSFYRAGGVRLSGRGNLFTGNHLSAPRMEGPGWLVELRDHCVAENNRFDGNGNDVSVGAIITRQTDRITGNSFDRWPQVCIRRESSASTIEANVFTEVAAPYSEGVAATIRR